jgi:hypothetical protein
MQLEAEPEQVSLSLSLSLSMLTFRVRTVLCIRRYSTWHQKVCVRSEGVNPMIRGFFDKHYYGVKITE